MAMAVAEAEDSHSTPSSIFSQKNSRLPDDTVFYSIFPDFASSSFQSQTTTSTPSELSSQLHSLHLQILHSLSSLTSDYIWQHQPFTLSPSYSSSSCFCSAAAALVIPHLHGKLRYGDNLEDEWFVVYLLFETSRRFPDLSIRVWDTDGEFLLIESAFQLPTWLNPETSHNRVFIRRGLLRIIPKNHFPDCPSLSEALSYLFNSSSEEEEEHNNTDSASKVIESKIENYPERARRNMHMVRVMVPAAVAQVLKQEPCLISLAVEGFYDRDVDSMKFAARMERFLPGGRGEELIPASVRMSRAMYAQLVQQNFQAPKCYPLPDRNDVGVYVEAELGMKIACGLEMMYQTGKKEGLEGKGSTWEAFRESLERSGYFQGLLPGSKEYRRLMENAEEYYKNSSLHSRASEMMSAPVRRVDEILALPYSAEDFKGQDRPPSDDDSWLYGGEDELTAALEERQKEMELYNLKHKKKQKSKKQEDVGTSSGSYADHGLGDVAKSMQAFVQKISSHEGAEVPDLRNLKDVDFDVDRFMKDMESVIRLPRSEDISSDNDVEEGSSSDMDFDDFEDGSDITEPSEDNEEGGDTFMRSYTGALNEELKSSTLNRSFVRAREQPLKRDEGTSNGSRDMDEDFTPVDVDVNLVKSFLDSFSSQQGLPGPASNLLGLMGLQLPQDASKDK